MANDGHQVLEFAYDWLGRRISKKVTTTTVAEVSGTLTATTATDQRTYLYDGWNLALSTQKKEGS